MEKPTLIKDLGMIYPNEMSKKKRRYGIFKCSVCGIEKEAQISTVKRKKQYVCVSCANTQRSIKHGLSGEALQYVWSCIKQRCTNKNNSNYKNYGARGITVCDEWFNSYEVFRNWALFNGYNESLSIDRINNNGNYEPNNCRFVSQKIQSRNTRLIYSHNTSGYRGVSFNKKRNKWYSFIRINGKSIYLGSFNFSIDAAYAYDKYVIDNKLEHTINFKEKSYE